MARMKKVDLIAKIAKEQNLNPEQLERLPMIELEKMDKVVPDADGSDILGDDTVPPSDAGQDPVVEQDSVSDAPVGEGLPSPEGVSKAVYVGNHPVTGDPVFE